MFGAWEQAHSRVIRSSWDQKGRYRQTLELATVDDEDDDGGEKQRGVNSKLVADRRVLME